ncbi:hypothetical protein [Bowdeniella nasicola]|uniref:hypothetical protein n=1 Tax=Bowdeniella nasicola TaxID=208480 RepID=UPI00116107B6|nr:hypothetical protein [Bowdeniella nasicola]
MHNKILSATLGVLILFSPALPASSNEHPSEEHLLTRVIELQGGGDRSLLKELAADYAKDNRITRAEALAQAIGELKAAAKEEAAIGDSAATADSIDIRSGGGGTRKLVNATQKGDIFYTPARTLTYNHAHVGIYNSTSTVVHAPGEGLSRQDKIGNVEVSRGSTRLMTVWTTQGKRNSAANYAYNHLRNRPYRINFAFNKTKNGAINCSQLVWVAYHDGSGIDLDSDGGPGVYPHDILYSRSTHVYKIF